MFRHRPQRINHLTIQQPEVGRVWLDAGAAQMVDQPVERPGTEPFEMRGIRRVLANGVNDLLASLSLTDKFQDQIGRVLQVGVHGDDRRAAGRLHAGGQGRLMAEVAR